MTDSIKGQIIESLATRLATVTNANGYITNVKKVYSDKIPMGIQLSNHQLPVIFLIDGPDSIQLEHSCVKGGWDIRLQLWNVTTGDINMIEFMRDVFKAIYANSATAQRTDAFRQLHDRLVQVTPITISPDLNMIEANRVTELSFLIEYRTKLFDM